MSLPLRIPLCRNTYFQVSELQLHAFSNVEWARDTSDRRSHSGHLILLGNNLISWKSGKQPTVSRSSTEAKYQSLADAAAKLNWTTSIIKEMGFTLTSPLKLACDNNDANYLARNQIHHGKAKHVAISYHFVQEQVSNGSLIVQHVRSEEQPADVLTKPLPKMTFSHMKDKLICKLLMSLWEGCVSRNNSVVS